MIDTAGMASGTFGFEIGVGGPAEFAAGWTTASNDIFEVLSEDEPTPYQVTSLGIPVFGEAGDAFYFPDSPAGDIGGTLNDNGTVRFTVFTSNIENEQFFDIFFTYVVLTAPGAELSEVLDDEIFTGTEDYFRAFQTGSVDIEIFRASDGYFEISTGPPGDPNHIEAIVAVDQVVFEASSGEGDDPEPEGMDDLDPVEAMGESMGEAMDVASDGTFSIGNAGPAEFSNGWAAINEALAVVTEEDGRTFVRTDLGSPIDVSSADGNFFYYPDASPAIGGPLDSSGNIEVAVMISTSGSDDFVGAVFTFLFLTVPEVDTTEVLSDEFFADEDHTEVHEFGDISLAVFRLGDGGGVVFSAGPSGLSASDHVNAQVGFATAVNG